MKTELSYYEIFPKMVPAGEAIDVTIRPIGSHVEFNKDMEYTIRFLPITGSVEPEHDESYESINIQPMGGILRFTHAFPAHKHVAVSHDSPIGEATLASRQSIVILV